MLKEIKEISIEGTIVIDLNKAVDISISFKTGQYRKSVWRNSNSIKWFYHIKEGQFFNDYHSYLYKWGFS